jgi:GT2 family glycosyltransferase
MPRTNHRSNIDSPFLFPASLDLTVIIVSYNTAELTLQTVRSVLEASKAKHHFSCEIVIVDNHSTDDTLPQLNGLSKTTKIPISIIANKTNRGFAAANNQAIQQANGRVILLLNSDTIVQPDSLRKLLLSFAAHPEITTTADLGNKAGSIDRLGIVAATLLNPDQTPQPQGGAFPSLGSLFIHMTMLDDLPIVGKLLPSTQHTGYRFAPAPVSEMTDTSAKSRLKPHLHLRDWVGGTAMAIKREVIEEIGILDDAIFMYGEDVEYCLRAHDHHWDIAECLDAPIIHLGSASGSSARAITGEMAGYLYIWSKHKPAWQYPIVKTLLQLGCLLRLFLFGTIVKKPAKVSAYRQALSEITAV